MKKSYMLDTNICSYIIRRSPESVISRLQEEVMSGANIVISLFTYMELMYGAVSPKTPKNVLYGMDEFVAEIDEIVSAEAAVIQRGAEIQRELMKVGQRIGDIDSMIAAHAIMENCTLVTNNTREFARVPDLKLENWVAH